MPQPPAVETGRSVAVVGAGPAGLAAAQQLRRAGHAVTVYERDESGGGLIRFGVPHFKIEKWVIERRLDQLRAEGVEFKYGVDVGVDVSADDLRAQHDAVVIATGSRVPRDLPVPGRELDGVHFAMEYLYDRARCLEGNPPESPITAAGKHVLVVGGGDTGADCVGHSHREGAASVTQIELLGEPPERRPDDLTPWPRWPVKLRTSYALEGRRGARFRDLHHALTGNGSVQEVHWVQNEGKPPFAAVPGTEESHPVELVLLAMGFLGPEQELLDQLGVDRDARSNVKAGAYATSVEGIFAAGDARRGQSLIVWAINEGRQCARVADRYLRSLPAVDPHTRSPRDDRPLRLARPRRRPAEPRRERLTGDDLHLPAVLHSRARSRRTHATRRSPAGTLGDGIENVSVRVAPPLVALRSLPASSLAPRGAGHVTRRGAGPWRSRPARPANVAPCWMLAACPPA